MELLNHLISRGFLSFLIGDPRRNQSFLTVGFPLVVVVSISPIIFGVVYMVRRKIKFIEVLEEWESEYKPHWFSYKDLFIAAKGFRDSELLDIRGYGRVCNMLRSTSTLAPELS